MNQKYLTKHKACSHKDKPQKSLNNLGWKSKFMFEQHLKLGGWSGFGPEP